MKYITQVVIDDNGVGLIIIQKPCGVGLIIFQKKNRVVLV